MLAASGLSCKATSVNRCVTIDRLRVVVVYPRDFHASFCPFCPRYTTVLGLSSTPAVTSSGRSLKMAEGRVYNFSAGPSVMPLEVLEEVQKEMVNYKGCGMSVMEMSHRSKEFMAIAAEAEKDLRDIFGVPSDYKVLMLQGGATLQFSAIPLNMLGTKTKADYLVTGQWGEKAHKECNKYGTGQLACNTKSTKFTTIPQKSEWKLDPEAGLRSLLCQWDREWRRIQLHSWCGWCAFGCGHVFQLLFQTNWS